VTTMTTEANEINPCPSHQPSTSNPIAGQLVGHQDPGHVLQSFEQLTKEPGGGLGVPPGGDQNVEHSALLVNGPPQVVGLAGNLDEDLVKMPLVAWSGPWHPRAHVGPHRHTATEHPSPVNLTMPSS
jgi:hypothetical protein